MGNSSYSLLAQVIHNPVLRPGIQSITNGWDFFNNLLPSIITIAFGIAAAVFFFIFVFGAIQWITAGGDKGKLEDARRKIINALVGLLIVLLVYLIVQIVNSIFGLNIGLLGGPGGGGGIPTPGDVGGTCSISRTGCDCICPEGFVVQNPCNAASCTTSSCTCTYSGGLPPTVDLTPIPSPTPLVCGDACDPTWFGPVTLSSVGLPNGTVNAWNAFILPNLGANGTLRQQMFINGTAWTRDVALDSTGVPPAGGGGWSSGASLGTLCPNSSSNPAYSQCNSSNGSIASFNVYVSPDGRSAIQSFWLSDSSDPTGASDQGFRRVLPITGGDTSAACANVDIHINLNCNQLDVTDPGYCCPWNILKTDVFTDPTQVTIHTINFASICNQVGGCGSGHIQANNSYLVGSTQMNQAFWRSGTGYVRTVPVAPDGSFDATGIDWNYAGDITGQLGTGSMQGLGAFTLAQAGEFRQAYWRGNQGWTRTLPLVNGAPLFGNPCYPGQCYNHECYDFACLDLSCQCVGIPNPTNTPAATIAPTNTPPVMFPCSGNVCPNVASGYNCNTICSNNGFSGCSAIQATGVGTYMGLGPGSYCTAFSGDCGRAMANTGVQCGGLDTEWTTCLCIP